MGFLMNAAAKAPAASMEPMPVAAPSRKRLLGLDIAKLLAMFQVVYIHFAFYTKDVANTDLSRAVLSLTVACVPIFIAVNGALLFSRPFDSRKHMRRVASSIALLFVWRAIHIACYSLMDAPRLSLSQTLAVLIGSNVEGYPTGHFWFLFSLIKLYILFPILKFAWDEHRRLLLPIAVCLLILYSGIDGVRMLVLVFSSDLYTRLGDAFDAFSNFRPFFGEGYLLIYFLGGPCVLESYRSLKSREAESKEMASHLPAIALALVLVTSALTVYVARVQYEAGLGVFGVSYGYWLPSTVVMTFAVLYLLLWLGDRLKQGRLLPLLGSGTFAVYMMHMPALVLFGENEHLLIAGGLTDDVLFLVQTLWTLGIFAALLAAGLLLRKVPVVGRLLSL